MAQIMAWLALSASVFTPLWVALLGAREAVRREAADSPVSLARFQEQCIQRQHTSILRLHREIGVDPAYDPPSPFARR